MQQNVLRLDISVYDVTVVHELDSVTDLPSYASDSLLLEHTGLPERVVDFSIQTRLENEVEMVLVLEKGVELDDVRVVQVALNFDLSRQLVDKAFSPLEYLLWNLF